ncbi:hypothetical protein [Niveispirillum fermenti]|uniref:hypothetical protein n=1 Tax=Niveispirillum fermenti TaxID=1233113 RepID=UPI003A88CFDD
MQVRQDFIIEIEEEALGLVVAGDEDVVFHAVHPGVQRLHGRHYPDALSARLEAIKAFRAAA